MKDLDIRRPLWILSGIAGILAFLMILNIVAENINWDIVDFGIVTILLITAGVSFEIALRIIKSRTNRITALVVILVLLVLILVEIGVGLFGTPFAGS